MRAFVASLAWTLSSQASPESGERTPVRMVLSESLPEECAATTSIFERVRARTDRIQRVTTDDADAHVRLRVHREGERLLGELTVEEGAGRTERVVSASTCEDVVAAFAVMLVVALDADGQSLSPISSEPRREPAPTVAKPRPRPLTPQPKVHEQPRMGLSGGVGFALAAYEGFVFEPSMLLELRVETAFHARVRAALARSAHDSVETTSDRVDLVWTTGRVSFCGGPGWLHRHHVAICAGSSMGELEATVVRPGGPRRGLLWLTAGPSIVHDLDLGWNLGLQLEAGLSISVLSDRFYFEPATLAYQAPRVFPFLGATLVSHILSSSR